MRPGDPKHKETYVSVTNTYVSCPKRPLVLSGAPRRSLALPWRSPCVFPTSCAPQRRARPSWHRRFSHLPGATVAIPGAPLTFSQHYVRPKGAQGQAGVGVFRISLVRPLRSLALPLRLPNIMCASKASKAKLASTFFASPWCDRGVSWCSPGAFPTSCAPQWRARPSWRLRFSHLPGATVAIPGAPLTFSQHMCASKARKAKLASTCFRISLVRPWRSLALPCRFPNIMCASKARKAKLASTLFASPWCDRGVPWCSHGVFPTSCAPQMRAMPNLFRRCSHLPGATMALPGSPWRFPNIMCASKARNAKLASAFSHFLGATMPLPGAPLAFSQHHVRVKCAQCQACIDVFRISQVRPWRSLALPWLLTNIMCASKARNANLVSTFFEFPWCDRAAP